MLAAGEQQVALRFTTNRLCWLEEVTGKPVAELVAELGGGKVRFADFRLIVAAAAGLDDVEAAGDIIDDAGMEATSIAIGQALEAAFPDVKDDAAPAGKKKAAA